MAEREDSVAALVGEGTVSLSLSRCLKKARNQLYNPPSTLVSFRHVSVPFSTAHAARNAFPALAVRADAISYNAVLSACDKGRVDVPH